MNAHDDIDDLVKLEFRDMVASHHRGIYNFCRLFADTPDEVNELVHEVVVALDRRFSSCHATTKRQQWHWMLRVMRSVVVDNWRRRLLRRTVPLSADLSVYDDDAGRNDRETLDELMSHLDNDQDREILHLLIQGYRYSEISIEMRISEATVRQRVSRAVKKMKTIKTKIYG